jgi:hypothetical protein
MVPAQCLIRKPDGAKATGCGQFVERVSLPKTLSNWSRSAMLLSLADAICAIYSIPTKNISRSHYAGGNQER